MAIALGARPPSRRLESIDALRGLVMVIMALDHARDFFLGERIDPTDLSATTPALFLTRWITHFCAPVFVLLAGTGAYLHGRRLPTRSDLSRFLLTRGLWLVVLELTFIRWGWSFDIGSTFFIGQVFWALGVSMMALSALIFLPLPWITGFGLVMIASHNFLDGVAIEPGKPGYALWAILHQGNPIQLSGTVGFFPLYPLIPWIGVMAAGYGFGQVLEFPAERRTRILWQLAGAMVLGFVLLRATNLYGDPSVWARQESGAFTVLSFLNCTKYPPSLLYLLMTLGPAFAVLAVWDRSPGIAPPFLSVLGRVPLFFYLLHVPILHASSALLAMALGRWAEAGFLWRNPPFRGAPEGFGHSLWITYGAWIGVVALLYPLCVWYGRLKERHRGSKWTSYL